MRLGKFGKICHWDNTSLGVGNIRRFTIIEIKHLFGIIVNVFNTSNQDRFHSHAFHAFSWMVRGSYYEDVILENGDVITKKIQRSRFIPKNYIHKITKSTPNAISVTFEGPWGSTWNEYFDNGRIKTYTWGRRVLFDSKRTKITSRRPMSDLDIDKFLNENEILFRSLGRDLKCPRCQKIVQPPFYNLGVDFNSFEGCSDCCDAILGIKS